MSNFLNTQADSRCVIPVNPFQSTLHDTPIDFYNSLTGEWDIGYERFCILAGRHICKESKLGGIDSQFAHGSRHAETGKIIAHRLDTLERRPLRMLMIHLDVPHALGKLGELSDIVGIDVPCPSWKDHSQTSAMCHLIV